MFRYFQIKLNYFWSTTAIYYLIFLDKVMQIVLLGLQIFCFSIPYIVLFFSLKFSSISEVAELDNYFKNSLK